MKWMPQLPCAAERKNVPTGRNHHSSRCCLSGNSLWLPSSPVVMIYDVAMLIWHTFFISKFLSNTLMACLDPLSFYKNWFLAIAHKN
jgi:hypothetical protein